MYKNLIFNYDKIKNIYKNELKEYKNILPNNRDNIPSGINHSNSMSGF